MENRYYRTQDLGESAALIASGQRPINIERVGKICFFVFINSETCKKLSYEYFFGNLMVNARDYHQAITRLKNRVFSGR